MQERVAIKIYTNAAGFSNEQVLYGKQEVQDAAAVPPMFVNNADRCAVTPYGFVFPPFTVTEECQPLSQWLKTFQADFITSMQVRAPAERLRLHPISPGKKSWPEHEPWSITFKQHTRLQVLGQVLKAVKALHAVGYAHRNIKPSNIMRRLKQHDWVLSDFACAAPLSAPHFCSSICLLPCSSQQSGAPVAIQLLPLCMKSPSIFTATHACPYSGLILSCRLSLQ